ncbi:MAG: lipocalin-like domain-containing protein, partial [Gammaproteobacteria bacterium]
MRPDTARSLLVVVVVLLAGCDEEPAGGPALGGQVRLGAVLGAADLDGFAVADGPRDFRFPADHGAHPAYRSDWWYLTMILDDEDGSSAGVQFTLFRQAVAPEDGPSENRWQSNQAYLAHFAITEVADGVHRVAQRYARGHPRLAGVTAEPFALWLEDWRIESMGRLWHLTARAPGQAVDLDLEMGIQPVLQGDAGLSRKGPGQASYYYSVPGIPVTGQVTLAGRERAVTGLGWLDREWSTSVLGDSQLGWDWFALQLDDGRKVMLYQLRRADGTRDPYDSGLLIPADGGRAPLKAADFTLAPRRYWR